MATLIAKKAAHGPAALHITRATQLIEYVSDPAKCDAMQRHGIYAEGIADAAAEMAAICEAADTRGKRKLLHHWIISTKREGQEEHPDNDAIMAASRELMAGLGYADCPYIVSIHANTDNRHAHIIVARVDAETGRIVPDSNDIYKAQHAIADISARHGWRPERGNIYQIAPDGEIVPRAKAEASKPRRGNIRTSTADDTITPATPRQTLAERLAAFADDTRGQWAAWKWGDLHKALALRGIEMQYTDRGQGRGGLAYSADGKTWIKASSACPEMTYPALSAALGAKAGSYRKARAGIAKIVEDARQRIKSGQAPELFVPEPQDVEQTQAPMPEAAQAQPPRQEAAQTQGAPRAPREERKEMTDTQLQYLALLARERADAQTRATLEAMQKAANIDFYRRNEDILKALYESKYTDADAYAQLKYNATRYHLRRIAMDEARRRRDADETRRNRRQYVAFRSMAAEHAATGQDPRRVATIMMYRAGASASDIAARLVAGMMDENPAEMGALEMIGEQIGEQIGEALDAVITEALRDRGRWEKLDAEIAKIEDAYADMSIHAPAEYKEGMEARKQEAIAAARALAAWEERQERAAQKQGEKPAPTPTPTAADARIFARHATEAEKTAPAEKTKEMIALRLRACGHKADDAVRIMCAGMDIKAAVAAVASMYRTAHGDEMLRIAREHAAQWKREEYGQANIRRNGGATQAQKPAAAAAPKPKM